MATKRNTREGKTMSTDNDIRTCADGLGFDEHLGYWSYTLDRDSLMWKARCHICGKTNHFSDYLVKWLKIKESKEETTIHDIEQAHGISIKNDWSGTSREQFEAMDKLIVEFTNLEKAQFRGIINTKKEGKETP
jgi:hypothetical protein